MAFNGMRATDNWIAEQVPENWRETILLLWPNGDVPMTAFLAKMKSERLTEGPKFHWFEKGLPEQRAAVTGVYTDAAMSSAYTTGGAVGQILYVKCSSAVEVSEFRIGHQVLLRGPNFANDTNAKVVGKEVNGANSKLSVKLLQADPTTTGIAATNLAMVISSINPQGGTMPDAIAYDPTPKQNTTQIMRTSLSMTRTALRTRLRTPDHVKEAKRECLQMHSIEIEKAFLRGYMFEGVGDNGKPETTTMGLINAIRAAGSGATISHFPTDTSWSGAAWADKGEEWLDYQLSQIFRYGGAERTAYCGYNVILQLNKLIKATGNYALTTKQMGYGIKVTEWFTPFGTLYLRTHPLLSYEATDASTVVIFDNDDLVYRYIDDTTYYDDSVKKNGGRGRVDGIDEEYLTEAGLEFHHVKKCAFLSGFGTDNSV